MDTQEILTALGLDVQHPILHGNNFDCHVTLYRCNLNKNDVSCLFVFCTDPLLEELHIEIPVGDVEDIWQHDICFHRDITLHLMSYIRKRVDFEISNYPYSLVYVVFSILHEIGHWYYLDQNGISFDEYIQSDNLEKIQIQAEMNKGTLQSLFDNYRRVRGEKAADTYAFDNLREAVNLVVRSK